MFSPEFRERLRLGKYSRWAVNLTEGQLEAIIWMFGECGYRAYDILPLLTELWGEEGSGRAALAVEALYRVVGGDRPDLETWRGRVQRFLAEVRKYADEAGGVARTARRLDCIPGPGQVRLQRRRCVAAGCECGGLPVSRQTAAAGRRACGRGWDSGLGEISP